MGINWFSEKGYKGLQSSSTKEGAQPELYSRMSSLQTYPGKEWKKTESERYFIKTQDARTQEVTLQLRKTFWLTSYCDRHSDQNQLGEGRMYLAYTSWSQLVTKGNQSRNSRQEPEVKKSERHGGVHLTGPSSPDAPWPAQEWPCPQWAPTGQSHGRILFAWSSHCPDDTSLCQADKNITRIEDPHETLNLPALWSQSPQTPKLW